METNYRLALIKNNDLSWRRWRRYTTEFARSFIHSLETRHGYNLTFDFLLGLDSATGICTTTNRSIAKSTIYGFCASWSTLIRDDYTIYVYLCVCVFRFTGWRWMMAARMNEKKTLLAIDFLMTTFDGSFLDVEIFIFNVGSFQFRHGLSLCATGHECVCHFCDIQCVIDEQAYTIQHEHWTSEHVPFHLPPFAATISDQFYKWYYSNAKWLFTQFNNK